VRVMQDTAAGRISEEDLARWFRERIVVPKGTPE